ncbi:hypothetical protein [Arthrobacter sp.]|uniref:hypothetical protein n=1 Tax=Arthrobacter sp. TaxID=1667 RepID=UPI003A92BEBB
MADKPNRTPPPGVKAQKTALAIARWLALAVIIIAIIIAVTSCSSGAGEAPASDPHGGSSSAPASVSAPAGPAADAVAAGIERAASYNFTLTAVATAADLKALRAAPQDTLEGATVAPQSCRTAVRELNWSPASLGEDSARTDFAADGVDATGSVEVARVTDGTALKAHYATVKQMLGDCSDVTLSISGTEVPLRSTAPPAQVTATATSALLWSRAGKGSDLRQQALVLIGERDGYVAMVSFIGTSGLENAKFSSMAGGILDATLDELA